MIVVTMVVAIVDRVEVVFFPSVTGRLFAYGALIRACFPSELAVVGGGD